MRETLHIFRKDVRRHWPEVLVGLILLGLYVRLTLKPPEPRFYGAFAFPWFRFSLEAVRPLTVFFWIFLSVRVVQGETLVGDRQWWITKPYEWWTLLAAKELFLLLFLNVPLFGVQLYLLHHAGFPIVHNLGGVLGMQLQLALVLVLPSVTLASVTRGFGQVMIGVVAIIGALWAGFTTMEKIPNSDMSFVAETSDTIAPLLLLGCVFAAVGWQYSRRKTWPSRGLLALGALAAWMVGAVTPYAKLVERKYSVADRSWPIHVSLLPQRAPESKKFPDYWEKLSVIPVRLAVKITGIPEKHWVQVAGARPVLESTGNGSWDPGWQQQGRSVFGAPGEDKYLDFTMQRADYERLKGQDTRLHIEVALTEYEESEHRVLFVKEGEVADEILGICQWNRKTSSKLACRKPFHSPGIVATVQPDEFKCIGQDPQDVVPGEVSRVQINSSDADAGFDPIMSFQLEFSLKPAVYILNGKFQTRRRSAHLCGGAIVHLAKPKEKDDVRVLLTSDHIRLEDIIRRDDFDIQYSEE